MTGEPERNSGITPEQQRAIESLFDHLPAPYDERYAALQRLRSAFYGELARHLQPALNAYVRTRPLNTVEERSDLASWINQTLRHLGLTLVSPNNEPAILIADTAGSSRKPRFRFQTIDVSGKRVRTNGTDELPDLELMQVPGRVENLAKEFRNRGPNKRS